ncbi:agmatinase [Bosea lathyri]|uniref:Agmatinase n=1 Tax=Bosea lathyri TaxID=1036778 RepID=A0A1H5ZWW3_9HYPH|nr:agmatinase [Bosea lathyri]SEG40177.1 agmatinase [Bosea lathyri]
MTLTTVPKTGHQTFLYSELATDLDTLKADIAFLGIPYGDAYSVPEIVNDQSNMPAAMRRASDRIVRSIERYDFDLGGPLYDNRPIRAVDCGDVAADIGDLKGHYGRAEAAVRKILAAGAMPIVIGGDHGVPIPVLRAMDGEGPITLIQIDQHLDWRDDVNGVREGYSSPIRRASEMAHVGEIFQIGLRATGSARNEEVEAARAYGAHLISAYELHDHGMEAVLDRIPAGGRYYLTVDLDGMDPSIAPAVAGPCPGGVTFPQARKLIHGLVAKGRVVGMDVVEITPRQDVNQITCITAGRLIVNMIGAAVRAGYFEARA